MKMMNKDQNECSIDDPPAAKRLRHVFPRGDSTRRTPVDPDEVTVNDDVQILANNNNNNSKKHLHDKISQIIMQSVTATLDLGTMAEKHENDCKLARFQRDQADKALVEERATLAQLQEELATAQARVVELEAQAEAADQAGYTRGLTEELTDERKVEVACEFLKSGTYEFISEVIGGYDMKKGYEIAIKHAQKLNALKPDFDVKCFNILMELDSESGTTSTQVAEAALVPQPSHDPFLSLKEKHHEIWKTEAMLPHPSEEHEEEGDDDYEAEDEDKEEELHECSGTGSI